jgi:hypothetical protein
MFNLIPTTELKALKELDLMDSNASTGLNQLKFYAGQSYNAFWLGEISPTIKVQMLGDKALSIFQASALTQQFIKTLDHSWEMLEVPEGYEVIFNEDGSAIINEVDEQLPAIEEPLIEEEIIEEEIIPE